MIVQKRHQDGFTLLNVEGVIKLGESAQFFAQTLERTLSDDRGHVIIDFSKINFMDSTGIGVLVGYLGRFRNSKRELILVNPSDRIRKLLQVARLDSLFPTYDSMEAAIAAERSARTSPVRPHRHGRPQRPARVLALRSGGGRRSRGPPGRLSGRS